MRAAIIAIVAIALAACASMTPQEKQLVGIAANHQLLKAVEKTADPVATKNDIIAGIDAVEEGVDGKIGAGGADLIVATLQKHVKWEARTADEKYLHSQVWDLVRQDLTARFGIQASAPLTAPQAAAVKDYLESMRDALKYITAPVKPGPAARTRSDTGSRDGPALQPS